jgi:glycosyltransferase involved in cell wall biosynthesis
MRILHLIPDLGLGGAQRMLTYAATAMDRDRYSVQVAHWGEASAFQTELECLGVPVIRLEPGDSSLFGLARTFGRQVRRLRPDVVHTHLFDADLIGILTARALGIRCCCSTIHSFSFFSTPRHRWRYRLLLQPLVRRFFAVSRALAEFLVRECRLPASRIRVVVNGVDTARFAPAANAAPRSAPGPTVGVLTRLDARKGLPYLIQAMAQIRSDLSDARLLIGGDGEDRSALQRQARSLGLTERVEFVGAVSEPATFYRQLDLFVLPSLDEALGLVLLEAMASGLPVVGTRVGGIPEILEDGAQGLLVAPADSRALAGAIRALWSDPLRRSRMGEMARQQALRFDIGRTAKELQAAYEELA